MGSFLGNNLLFLSSVEWTRSFHAASNLEKDVASLTVRFQLVYFDETRHVNRYTQIESRPIRTFGAYQTMDVEMWRESSDPLGHAVPWDSNPRRPTFPRSRGFIVPRTRENVDRHL